MYDSTNKRVIYLAHLVESGMCHVHPVVEWEGCIYVLINECAPINQKLQHLHPARDRTL